MSAVRSSDFVEQIIAAARRKQRRIVLPESMHAGVLLAAAMAHNDNIADCVLLGDVNDIQKRACELEITLPDSLTMMSPPAAEMAPALAKLRAHKGLDEAQAETLLRDDTIAVAAMLVHEKKADGMVAGAAHASAAVLRPVLQIIGKAADAPLASSFFLMDMPNRPLLFADCALNMRPSAEELAAIAEQSAASARHFGITPIIAMLSYATDNSAAGEDAERVREATVIARRQMPDIPILGPIQYDAAVSPTVAAVKVPQWESAGHANTLIFPDLAAGNITYKAVQQAASVSAIGPLMQGLAAPANDLSRGATADDIYHTIAATAAQAAE